MSDPAPWLSSTDLDVVASATDESLRRALITCDGAGEKLKTAALDELIRRRSAALSTFIHTARQQSELLETPGGPRIMVPYWFMRDDGISAAAKAKH
jgi:hypothetical protein